MRNMRVFLAGAILPFIAPFANGQFQSLATTDDGAVLYFGSLSTGKYIGWMRKGFRSFRGERKWTRGLLPADRDSTAA